MAEILAMAQAASRRITRPIHVGFMTGITWNYCRLFSQHWTSLWSSHSVQFQVCLATVPEHVIRRVLHRVTPRSSSSCLRLLPHFLASSISFSMRCFRRQFPLYGSSSTCSRLLSHLHVPSVFLWMRCFRRQFPLYGSSSSGLRLLSRLLVPSVFLSVRCFRRQFPLYGSFTSSLRLLSHHFVPSVFL
jgi:cell shape-determining protein MreD